MSQIKVTYAFKNKRLKHYMNVVWDQIKVFDNFGISWIDISSNKMADLLANVGIMPNDMSFSGVSCWQ